MNASFSIILEWNARQLQVLHDNPALLELMWRQGAGGRADHRVDPDQRMTMLFARAVPAVFALAWAVLTALTVGSSSR